MLIIDLGPVNQYMTSGYRFASLLNPSYFYATPWFLSFFSLNLLLRSHIKV